MYVVTDGNPDILDTPGVALMKELMDTWGPNNSSDIMEYLVSIIFLFGVCNAILNF